MDSAQRTRAEWGRELARLKKIDWRSGAASRNAGRVDQAGLASQELGSIRRNTGESGRPPIAPAIPWRPDAPDVELAPTLLAHDAC
jgi:hypothetical protein